MTQQWIDLETLPTIRPGQRLILFGAGQGTVDFLEHVARSSIRPHIVAIADNDASMHGKRLRDIPILPPDKIPEQRFSAILVTTISGKEAVALQLSRMGYRQGKDFFCIGRYPITALAKLCFLLDLDRDTPFLRPSGRILHVGPGGFLGLECCLHALGYETVSMDAFGFGLEYPEVTKQYEEYQAVLQALSSLPLASQAVRERYAALFRKVEGTTLLDATKIPLLYPHRFSAIPLPEASVEAVVSFAVLEHVRRPEAAIREIRRVLREGGTAVQTIIPRDHRSYGQVSGYHPFSYLNHSQKEWDTITRDAFYQNRVLPRQWRDLFAAGGFDIETYMESSHYELTSHEFAEINANGHFHLEEPRQAMTCTIVARKHSS